MNEMTATALLLVGCQQTAAEAQALTQRLTLSLGEIVQLTQAISELAAVNPDEIQSAQESAQQAISIENARLEIQGYIQQMIMQKPLGEALVPGLLACENLRLPYERRADELREQAAAEFTRQAAERDRTAQEEAQAEAMVRVLTRAGYVVAKRKQREAA